MVIFPRSTETELPLQSTLTQKRAHDNTPNVRGMEKVSRAGRSTVTNFRAKTSRVRADTLCAHRHAAMIAAGLQVFRFQFKEFGGRRALDGTQ
jgi:hypothetical protein